MKNKEFASIILKGMENSLEKIAHYSGGQSEEWKIKQLKALIMTVSELCKDEICKK